MLSLSVPNITLSSKDRSDLMDETDRRVINNIAIEGDELYFVTNKGKHRAAIREGWFWKCVCRRPKAQAVFEPILYTLRKSFLQGSNFCERFYKAEMTEDRLDVQKQIDKTLLKELTHILERKRELFG